MKELFTIGILAITMYAGTSFNSSVGDRYNDNIDTIRDRMIDRQFYTGRDYYNSNRRK